MKDTKELEYQLEDTIDKNTLEDVMHALVNICYGKAEHLRENWQDNQSAKQWELAAKRIDKALAVWPTLPGIS
jgi:hypothetical protein